MAFEPFHSFIPITHRSYLAALWSSENHLHSNCCYALLELVFWHYYYYYYGVIFALSSLLSPSLSLAIIHRFAVSIVLRDHVIYLHSFSLFHSERLQYMNELDIIYISVWKICVSFCAHIRAYSFFHTVVFFLYRNCHILQFIFSFYLTHIPTHSQYLSEFVQESNFS